MTSPVASDNGERQIGYHGEGARELRALDPARIGARAAQRAVEKLGARSFPTQRLAVVLEGVDSGEIMHSLVIATRHSPLATVPYVLTSIRRGEW